MKLIDIEKRMEEWEHLCNVCFPNMPCQTFEQFIENAPTVDAVPVIRCKDCKYWKKAEYVGGESYMNCTYLDIGYGDSQERNAEDFCSYAEMENND